MPADPPNLWSIEEHRKTVLWRGCRGMNVHVSGNSGEALTIVFVRIFTLHESHYHGYQARKWFSLLSLSSFLEASLIIRQNPSRKDRVVISGNKKDKCYIHRGGVGNTHSDVSENSSNESLSDLNRVSEEQLYLARKSEGIVMNVR